VGVVAHACNLSTQETEAGRSLIGGQPRSIKKGEKRGREETREERKKRKGKFQLDSVYMDMKNEEGIPQKEGEEGMLYQ
jgi:hypothetical protein